MYRLITEKFVKRIFSKIYRRFLKEIFLRISGYKHLSPGGKYLRHWKLFNSYYFNQNKTLKMRWQNTARTNFIASLAKNWSKRKLIYERWTFRLLSKGVFLRFSRSHINKKIKGTTQKNVRKLNLSESYLRSKNRKFLRMDRN